jgi:hypothetical protein
MARFMHIGLLLVTTTLCSTAIAADVYRWIDENGRTQISDQPPPKGSGAATKTPLPMEDVTPERRRAAQDRTAKDRAALRRIDDERAARARNSEAAASAPEPSAALPPRGSTEGCRNSRQDYSASQACFAPYRNATGGLKPEAFAACGPEVLDPSRDCGLPSN